MNTVHDPVRLEQSQIAAVDDTMQALAYVAPMPRHIAPPTPANKHALLMRELVDALESGHPERKCWTPGFSDAASTHHGHTTAADIVLDGFAAASDTSLLELLQLVGACCKSRDLGLRLKTQAWVASVARAHADFHEGDAA